MHPTHHPFSNPKPPTEVGLETIGNEVLSSAMFEPFKIRVHRFIKFFKKLMVSRFSFHHKY
jgi:hypothetical protein